MSSILTNNSAMVALQTLKTINSSLEKTQSEISTGKSIGGAKDNASVWALSKVMESDVAGFDKVAEGLSMSQSTVGVARTAAETTTDLLKKIKEKIVQAQDPAQDRDKLKADIDAYVKQIDDVVGSAQFNGVNLVSGGADLTDLSALTTPPTNPVTSLNDTTPTTDFGIAVVSGLNRAFGGAVTSSSIYVFAQDLGSASLTGEYDNAGTATDLTLSAIDISDDENAGYALAAIEGMIDYAIDVSAAFGTAQNQLDTQAKFVSQLTDAMKSGIGTMVDADMEEASARLQALQVQQQLGVQALSIANQAPQTILSLFR